MKLLLKFGLFLIASGLAALALLLIYNHGLEDTIPFFLYIGAWVTIPVGVLCCLIFGLIKLARTAN